MPGMSGVLIRQLNDDHAVRSRHITERLRRQDDKDRHDIELAAKRVASSLTKQEKADRLMKPAYRAPESPRTTMIGVYLVNKRPTRNRTQYFVGGEGTLYRKGAFDSALSVVDVRKMCVADREDLASILGVTLAPID